jgi:hypothetical protein
MKGEAMPSYIKIPFPSKSGMTIAKYGTLFWEWTWEGSGAGPNMGPVMFTADPVSHQSGLTSLVTTDIAKCRRAPGAGGSTEVFYRFAPSPRAGWAVVQVAKLAQKTPECHDTQQGFFQRALQLTIRRRSVRTPRRLLCY